MTTSTEEAYRYHHSKRDREGFSILELERGPLFQKLIGNGNRVLDIGCRDGTLTRYFTKGNEVTGVDIDSHALTAAATMLGIQTMQFDINASAWPLDTDAYDVVVMAEVLEHLYMPDVVLKKVHRVLRPGGVFIGSVPNAFSLKCRLRFLLGSKRGTPLADPMHINQFEWSEFRTLLCNDFTEVELYPLGRKLGGFRNTLPALFSFGIGFRARKI